MKAQRPLPDLFYDPRHGMEEPIWLSRKRAQEEVEHRQFRLLGVQAVLLNRVVELGEEKSLTDGMCIKLRHRLTKLLSIEYEISRRFHKSYNERRHNLYMMGLV